MNIITYSKKFKDRTMFEDPFNNVDALIMAELSYINFGDEIKGDKFVSLKELNIHDPDSFYYGSVDASHNKKLLNVMKDSFRYGDIKIGMCESLVDLEHHNQFYAITIILPTNEAFISFRGTDISVNGWREDLLIAYRDSIPGHKCGIEYVKKVTSKIRNKFYLGGHSKGGNLAACVGLMMDKKLNNRLISIYSFDGPGVGKEDIDFKNYDAAMPKIKKFLTKNDVVGVVYNKIKNAKIVNSYGVLLGGHDPFGWLVNPKAMDFSYSKDRSMFSKSHEEALMKWLTNMSQDDKQLAIETLCDFFGESVTIFDLLKYASKNLSSGKKNWDEYSLEQREQAKRIFKKLGKYYAIAYSPKNIAKKKKKTEEDEYHKVEI